MTPPSRRVLVITAAWPPVGRVGVRRPLRLVRRLPALGWTPVVLTPDPEAAFRDPPPRDGTLTVPEVEVHRVPAVFPSVRLSRALHHVPRAGPLLWRALAAARLPDQLTEWTPAAVRAARRLEPVDVVWVTGGPFGIFLAAAAVATVLRRPLVLDYRDPWTVDGPPRRGPLRAPLPVLRALERGVLRRAAAAIYVNDDMRAQNARVFGSATPPRQHVIPNGFDRGDLGDAPPERPARPTVLYAGNCYGDRSMEPVLQALQSAFGPGDQGLVLQVFGALDAEATRFLAAHPLPGRVEIHDRIPGLTLAPKLRGAGALLLIIADVHRAALSAKVFDYLAAGRPILGVGPVDSDAAALVRRCGVGRFVEATDADGLVDALRAVQAGTLPFAPVADEIARHSADTMAADIAAVLDAVVTP